MEEHHRPETSAWLAKLACELEAPRLAAFIDCMERAVRSSLPAYERLPGTAGFREGLERTARSYCRTLAEQRALDSKERLGLHLIGSQRARHGFVADDMGEAVKLAVSVGWGFALRVLRTLGADADTVEAVSAEALPLTVAFVDDVREELLVGYRLDAEEQLPAQVRVQATVIDRLLLGADSDEALYEVIRSQSLDIRPPCGLLVVTASSHQELAHLRSAATAIAALPKTMEGPSRPSASPPHVVLLATAVGGEWEALLSAVGEVARSSGVVAVAVDDPIERLVNLSAAYHAVEGDLHLARRARRGPGLVPRRRLAVYRMLSHVPPEERVEFVTEALGPVLAKGRKGETYLLAYEAWVESDCDYEMAGALLGERAHTVRYRMKRIEELTGLDLASGEGRMHLDLAVRLHRAWVEEVLVDRHTRSR